MTEGRGTGVLRAAIEYEDISEVRCAIELSDRSVFVLSDACPPLGTRVRLCLSFPGLFLPVDLWGHVAHVKVLDGPGAACGFVCELDTSSETARERLGALLQSFRGLDQGATGDLRVLLVEDSGLVRQIFAYTAQQYFQSRPGTLVIDQAPDVETAWTLLSAQRYDLVLVDYFLPADNGGALIARIRSDRDLAATPVLAMSVGGSKARSATLSAGADLFLDKPVVLRDLFRTFEYMMAREKSRVPA